jgi:hypothetical protein
MANKTKLSKEQVENIIISFKAGNLNVRATAKEYGVSRDTIYRQVNEKIRLHSGKWSRENKDWAKEYYKRQHQERKRRVLQHYCSGLLKCACCGEKEIDFLSIDHINGGRFGREIGIGSKDKKLRGRNLYYWLEKDNFPVGFRVLCFNCNHAYGHYGKCPHQKNL